MSGEKKPTEMLKEEHQEVLKKLDTLEDAINHLDKKEEVFAKLIELASFFKTDIWVHFSKEEEALFPELEKFIPRQSGPLGIMLLEHDDLRKTNTEFQRGIELYRRDSASLEGKRIVQKYGDHFIGVLRDHILKENNVLFEMAERHLNGTQIDKVLRLFSEIEKRERGKNQPI